MVCACSGAETGEMRRVLWIVALAVSVVVVAGCLQDGTYTIGSGANQAPPGNYWAPGGPSCTWSRTTSDAQTVTGGGNTGQSVTLQPSDTRFQTSGCGAWEPPAQAPVTFSGSGTQVTDPFTAGAGIALFSFTYQGSDNFIVWLVDGNGKELSLLANAIGDYSGAQAVNIPSSGAYRLQVESNGPWTGTMTEPRPKAGQKTPITFSGTGSGEAGPFWHAGATVFRSTYSGTDNFIVELLDSSGNWTGLEANEIGSTNVSHIESLALGQVYWLNVDANGPWTITVQPG